MNDCRACKGIAYGTVHTCAERTDPTYAQTLTPEAAQWLAERANPKFKPKGNPRPSKIPKLSEKHRARLEKEVRELIANHAAYTASYARSLAEKENAA